MKKILTLLLTLILTVGACLGLTACGKEKTASDVGVGDGKLVFGYTIYDPMSYFKDGSSELIGFDVELAKEVSKILNVEAEFVEINWNKKVLSLDSKEIDVIWNGMTISDELKEVMSITKPYFENKQVIVCKKDDASKFTADADKKGLDAAGLTVIVEKGSAGEQTAKDLDITPETVVAQKDSIIEIKSGSNKVAIIDKTMASVIVGENSANPDLTYVDVGFTAEQFGIGCRKKDTATTFAIEKAMDILKENGKFDEIFAKYFG